MLLVGALQDSALPRSPAVTRLELSASGQHVAQHVPAIAPGRFSGAGVGFTLALAREGDTRRTEIALSASYAGLSGGGASRNRDRVGTTALSIARHHRVGRIMLGLRLEAEGSTDEHTVTDHSAIDVFTWVAITLQPTASLSFPAFGKRLTASASLPLIGLADFPYGNTRSSDGVHLRPVTVTELQSLDGRITWDIAGTRRRGLALSYHFQVARQSRHDTRRYAQQGLSVRLHQALGRAR